ncbi:hypothetical protein VC83_00790 [Pseudogymnoascus destructans]|uniref:F5/8 type C domain-containing protein n=2 Tax=Pseudogymnoascus destructans TaxID=655981 RepID=L8FSW8_PSED2|nr:uncharacterized protein VC83_00790 [Pseudogymnoascus destructans]ELR02811.1 hypothetical protein GMDG_05748 [Pseudogymnoascus destructans 20631-21]OAF62324.1 hypothetical protein VC83_00790 [Pseudogymnoascus destructans]
MVQIALRRWWALALLLLINAVPYIQGQQSPSWAQYIISPQSLTVLPLAILEGRTVGDVTNPSALLTSGGDVTTLKRAAPVAPPSWPKGTTADASSFRPENTNNGQPRTYTPSNAIDGNGATFWNDDTVSAYSDILTLTIPTATTLSGITILSSLDGVPVKFTVEALQGGSWGAVATVSDNAVVLIQVPFAEPVNAEGIRITVTQAQATGQGEYTRIAEVWPGIVPGQVAPAVVLDFGKVVVGKLSINFAGASTNNPGIRLAFSETTQYLTDLSDFSRSNNGDTITPGSDQIAVKSDPYTWTDNHGCEDGTKVCADGLHGFRYVKIYLDALAADAPNTQASGSVSIDSISLAFSAYLGTEDTYSGNFECSDAALNEFWYAAVYTNDLCTDTFRLEDTEPRNAGSPTLVGKEVLFDGAKRDRDPYVGDLAVAARTLYLTHNFSIAAENVLADLADHQRSDGWIPPASINNYQLQLLDYPLHWVTCTYDLIVYTSSDAYAAKYYPTITKVLDNFYPSMTDSATGLINKPDDSPYGDYAFLNRHGLITYYNALYVQALRNAASIATFYNHPDDAKRWAERAQTVSDAINVHLWDASVGAYFDSSKTTNHGQDGNGLAVLNGIADSTRSASALKYWASLALPYGNPFFDSDVIGGGFSKRVYAFISYFELQARFASGAGDSAIEEIKRLYGWMATHDPKSTFWEGIGTDGSMYEAGFTSATHGWSTGIVPLMSNYVLGIMPTAPAFAEWTVKPMLVGGITWAKGQVDTPHGPLMVDWTAENASTQFQITVTVPKGTKGTVSVPVTSEKVMVAVNSKLVYAVGRRAFNPKYKDGHVTVQLEYGKHVITASK